MANQKRKSVERNACSRTIKDSRTEHMATPSSEQKAQHYIPNFYLKGFTDRQKRLWVCERFKPIRNSKPKDEANRPDYYTLAEQGRRNETAEDLLKQVESRAAQ